MTPAYLGKLLTLNLVLTIFGIPVKVEGTVEALDVRKRMAP